MSEPGTTVVIGVGNRLRGDDGIGPAVIDRLRGRGVAAGVRLVTCEGEVTELIEAWERATVAIVIDAVRSGAARPGSVHLVPREDSGWGQHARASSHGLGVQDAVVLARQLGRLPGDLVLIGVEGGHFGLGTPLSAPARVGIEQVVALVEQQLTQIDARAQRCHVPGHAEVDYPSHLPPHPENPPRGQPRITGIVTTSLLRPSN
ncbi:MAG TPA: hydrogenase maturation protease [Actinomycetota bacterium]|nr:hydrogenase maturation protease [Actinomycetota bacterium]